MKDEEKKVNEAEEVKTEENGIELSGDELAQVTGGDGLKIPTIWPPKT